MIPSHLAAKLDLDNGTIEGAALTVRRLSDLRECFHDQSAYGAALAINDPVLYTVASVDFASGDGQLHYGLGVLMPGKIGKEYFMTKGHLHSFRPAAEAYIGLRGDGCMILEDEQTKETQVLPLGENAIIYVPGNTAHRTINTGTKPLVYIGVYPSNAGHDYAPIAATNFRMAVVEHDGIPTIVESFTLKYDTKPIPDQKPEVGFVERPWGSFKQYVFNSECTVSLMTVTPGQRLSLQSHTGRAELWIVLDDGAHVQVGDEIREYKSGDEIWIQANSAHRLACAGDKPVRVLEVAFGNWQQADIVRYEDDYSRPEAGE